MDKDICNSVMDAKKVERSAADAGGDNDDDPTDVHTPGPTCQELFETALMLRKHVATLNNPFSHKFEVMLGLFGQQTCVAGMQDMMDAKLTDYFARK